MAEERADPRQVRSREAMLGAAAGLLAEGGLEAVTHQAVAARAGVGRATVYRHWPDLHTLRLAALDAGMPPLEPAPEELRSGASVEPRAELVHYLRQLGTRLDDAQAGAVLAAVLGAAQYDEGMQHLRQTLLAQIVDSLRPAVAAAVERGQLRPGVTAEDIAMSTVGPLVYQRFLVGSLLGRETVDAVADAALRAWAP
jgi:AcrR family transcriptional regulator